MFRKVGCRLQLVVGDTDWVGRRAMAGLVVSSRMRVAFGRRGLLVQAGVVAAAAATEGFVVEPYWLDCSEHDVAVEGLSSSLDGYRLAQITDAHLTSLGRVEQEVVRQIAERDVQLTVLTGDIVDASSALPLAQEWCRELVRTGTRVVALLGNWEHVSRVGVRTLSRAYAAVGASLLVNTSLNLEGALSLVATDDGLAGRVRIDQALRGERPHQVRVLLTHSPGVLDRLHPKVGHFHLSLAGHTHGGQVRLGPRLVPYLPPGSGRFASGWYDTRQGPAYVSRGTGTGVLPLRFTCRPELPVFTLRQA